MAAVLSGALLNENIRSVWTSSVLLCCKLWGGHSCPKRQNKNSNHHTRRSDLIVTPTTSFEGTIITVPFWFFVVCFFFPQDVIHGSDHEAVLQLTNLVEGTYTFHLKVTDAKGDSDIDSATVEVRPGMAIKRSSIRCEYLIFVLLFISLFQW